MSPGAKKRIEFETKRGGAPEERCLAKKERTALSRGKKTCSVKKEGGVHY